MVDGDRAEALVAALIASQDATLAPEQIRQVLRMTAADPVAVPDDRGENRPSWDLFSGWGLVNAGNAIDALRAGSRNLRNESPNARLA